MSYYYGRPSFDHASFMALFKYVEKSPSLDHIAEKGVPQNTLYFNVPITFLNGFINCVKPFFICAVEHHRDWAKIALFDLTYQTWTNIASELNPHYGKIDNDIMILAESKHSFWFFWFNQKRSDCRIGRLDPKGGGKKVNYRYYCITKDRMKNYLIEWIKKSPNPEIKGNFLELPLPKGRITF